MILLLIIFFLLYVTLCSLKPVYRYVINLIEKFKKYIKLKLKKIHTSYRVLWKFSYREKSTKYATILFLNVKEIRRRFYEYIHTRQLKKHAFPLSSTPTTVI